MSVATPDISVVIVSYNVREYLRHCIDSVFAQRDIHYEIVVVDNNSSDGTQDFIKSRYPTVKLLANSVNAGFSAANNQGIGVSSGEAILLLNPDTELQDVDTLVRMKDYLDSNLQTAIMAPCLLNSDASFQPSYWNFPGSKELLSELFYVHRIKKRKLSDSPIEVQAASGAALVFRRSLINEIGVLDENMFWMEDTDFCYRAGKTGKHVIFNPGIKIIHHGGKSSVGNEDITIPNQILSRIKFSKKHDSKLGFYTVNVISLIFISSRLIVFTLMSFVNQEFKIKRKGYRVALKSYFRFNFQNESSIIK